MNSKRISALITTLILILTLTACNNKNSVIEETTTHQHIPETTAIKETLSAAINEYNETTTVEATTEQKTVTQTEMSTKYTETTTEKNWTDALIINTYKASASKTTASVVSTQTISLDSISINNGEGAINSMLKLVKPVISKVVESNSTEFDGITGGFENLNISDIENAKAYQKNNNTIIKITLKQQTDGIGNDKNNGTVGHGISVIGDISVVLNQLTDAGLPMEIDDNNILMTYTEPEISVVIDNNGNIINGTWKYKVQLDMTDFTVAGSKVEKTSVVIKNVITINGGFSE